MNSNISKVVKATIFDVYQTGSKKLAEAVMDLNDADTANLKEMAVYVTQLSSLLKDFSDNTDSFFSSLDVLVSYMAKNKVKAVKKSKSAVIQNGTQQVQMPARKMPPTTSQAVRPAERPVAPQAVQQKAVSPVRPEIVTKPPVPEVVQPALEAPKSVEVPASQETPLPSAEKKSSSEVEKKVSDVVSKEMPVASKPSNKEEVVQKAKEEETAEDLEKKEEMPANNKPLEEEKEKKTAPLIEVKEPEAKEEQKEKSKELIPLIIPEVKEENSEEKKSNLTIPTIKNEEKSSTPHVKYLKDNTNRTKAILVSQKQMKKLIDSKKAQSQLLDFGAMSDYSNLDIESLLEKAGKLYHEGKTDEAQALYDKVSRLNKRKENVLVKKAA